MRVLVTTTSGLGHVLPVRPHAVELRARGHEVRWVVGPDSADAVIGAGFDATVAGMPFRECLAELGRRHPEAGSLPEEDRRALAFSTLFGELAAPSALDTLRPFVAAWPPDLVLHDAAELAGPLVAASIGVASVCVGFGEILPEASIRRAGTTMAALWRDLGMTPDRYAGSYRGLYVDIYPPSLRLEGMSHVPRAQPCRPAEGIPATGEVVYVTFGTVFNEADGGFRAAVAAAASVAPEVVATVGPSVEPSSLGPVPDNVRVERFLPQAEVLARSAAVVCHGGSGTLLASLAHGVPLLCLPRGADQFANATNVARVGAGRALVGPDATSGDALRGALEWLLSSPAPRAAAGALAAEIAAMPSEATVADAVEAHAADR